MLLRGVDIISTKLEYPLKSVNGQDEQVWRKGGFLPKTVLVFEMLFQDTIEKAGN